MERRLRAYATVIRLPLRMHSRAPPAPVVRQRQTPPSSLFSINTQSSQASVLLENVPALVPMMKISSKGQHARVANVHRVSSRSSASCESSSNAFRRMYLRRNGSGCIGQRDRLYWQSLEKNHNAFLCR